jgi:hypothetical protein
MLLAFDSKHFVESIVKAIMEGILFLSFAMLLDCFLGLTVKIPRGGKGVVGI